MELPKGSNSGWAGLIFMVLAMLQLSTGQPNVVFHYGTGSLFSNFDYFPLAVPNNPSAIINELQQDDIICLGDFFQLDRALLLSLPQALGSQRRTDVTGRCLYRNPIQLKQSNAFQSFSTWFDVQIASSLYTSEFTGGYISGTPQGLAFIIASDNFTQGDPKGYLGWLNATTDAHLGQASTGHNFAVEIDLVQDIQFQDPPMPHVGIDTNSLISMATQVADIYTSELDSQVEINVAATLTVWIEYDGSAQNLAVFVSRSMDEKPTTPTLSSKIDLRELLSQEYLFVGFSGSISNVTFSDKIRDDNQTSGFGFTIDDWAFNSNGLAPDLPRQSDGMVNFSWDRSNKSQRENIITTPLIPYHRTKVTIPSSLIFLVLVELSVLCFFASVIL